ncbi:MAG: large subunit ribosomal protein L2 [Candidatus Paceibacteria bacterium]|jgi:large subunit ribosomal protein L2
MKKVKPTTPGRRGMSFVSYKDHLTTDKPLKSLTGGFHRPVGRNSQGRITTRHKGSGNKRLYRQIDFKLDKVDIPAKIETVEYDPNRTGFISVILYADGERRYVLTPQTLKVGDEVLISENAKIKTGNRLPLSKLPVGTFIYNIELKPQNGAKLVRSAGNYAEVIAQDADSGVTHVKMPSSEVRKILSTAWASVGEVSNDEHRLVNIGKAGRKRHMGVRPTVRGSAMNAVDHPHGGGEGKSGIGRKGPRTRQGKKAYGVKTRKPKKYSNKMIVKRRKGKRNK